MDAFEVVAYEVLADQRRDVAAESIRLVREKYVEDAGMLAIEYLYKHSAAPYRALWGVIKRGDGPWTPAGSASRRVRLRRRRNEIWSMSGGWSSPTCICYGGWISDPKSRHLRMTDANDLAVRDDLKMGVALLICPSEFAIKRSRLELFADDGALLKSTAPGIPFN
jgi:hypothetical protein